MFPSCLKHREYVIFILMNFNSKLTMPVLVGALVLLTVGVGGYFYYQTQKNQAAKTNPQASAQEEVKKLVAEVGKLIELPTGEDPTVATVTDIDKLKDQPFFQKAKNGDKVLIYTNARKAILYDPNVKKVIDVAPINIGSPSAQTTTPEVKVALRNGTRTVGLTTKIEPEIKKVSPQFNVVSKENAQNSSYEKTLIIVINSSAQDLATDLAQKWNTSLSTLPAGETKPSDADLLIILGKDKAS